MSKKTVHVVYRWLLSVSLDVIFFSAMPKQKGHVKQNFHINLHTYYTLSSRWIIFVSNNGLSSQIIFFINSNEIVQSSTVKNSLLFSSYE